MTAQRLKNSILQMAVQGKLVPQDTNDEPASVLIQKIRDEKEQMIRDGEIKNEKNPSFIFRGDDCLFYEKIGNKGPVCIEDEVPFEIPDSWEWVRLKNISTLTGGYTFKSSKYVEKGVRVIRISDFDENGLIDKDCKFYPDNESLSRYLLHDYDILLCMTGGTVGKSCYLNELHEKMYLNQRVADIRSNSKSILQEYIYWILNSPYIVKAIHSAKTSTNDNISMATIGNFFIPVPPVCEQQRILKKINEVLSIVSKYDAVEKRRSQLNTRFPKKLKNSILQIAVQGKLVPQNPDDEPASVLIEKIHDEKEQLIKGGKIKRDKHESVIYRRDGSYYEKVDGKERCIDDEIPFEIPDSWEWARLGMICTKLVDGDHNPPRGEAEETPYIMASSTNINNDTLVELSKVRYLTKEVFKKEDERTRVREGDIFFTSVGSLGRSCVYTGGKYICFQRSVTVITTLIYNYYLKLYLDCAYVQQKIVVEATGTAQKGFYLNQLEKLLVPVPPIKEQRRIVDKVNQAIQVMEV